MDTFKRVLVSLDLTESGEEGPTSESLAALSQARWIAQACKASVSLMTVLPEADSELIELAEFRLKAMAVEQLADLDVSVTVATGTAFIELVRAVIRQDVDLLVVGPRSMSRRHPGVVGSTARRVVRKAPCPVLVAPHEADGTPKSVLSSVAWHTTAPMILGLSAAICAETGAAWNVLHVPEYPAEGGMRLRCAPEEELVAYRKQMREEAWTRMHEVIDPLAEASKLAPELWMSEGYPSEQIFDAIARLDADLLVMGTIEKQGLAGLLLGGTAEKVLDALDIALLVIKPPDFVCPISLDD